MRTYYTYILVRSELVLTREALSHRGRADLQPPP